MENTNLLTVLAIVVVVIALANVSISFVKFADFNQKLTGNAIGYVNLTVDTVVAINALQSRVDWGRGSVNGTEGNNATLITHMNSGGTVVGGNWSGANALAFDIQNLGSVNCSISLQSNKNATDLVGGNGSLALFQWNFTNKDPACGAWNQTGQPGTFMDVNKTVAQTICNKMDFFPGRREIWVDFKIMVPVDAPATANTEAQITITGSTAN